MRTLFILIAALLAIYGFWFYVEHRAPDECVGYCHPRSITGA